MFFLFVDDFMDFCVLYLVTFAVVNGFIQGLMLGGLWVDDI